MGQARQPLSVLTARVWAEHPHWTLRQVRQELARRAAARRAAQSKPAPQVMLCWWMKD